MSKSDWGSTLVVLNLICVIGTVLQIARLSDDFFNYMLTSNIKLSTPFEVELPGFTICFGSPLLQRNPSVVLPTLNSTLEDLFVEGYTDLCKLAYCTILDPNATKVSCIDCFDALDVSYYPALAYMYV